jgi:hypothetical protein
VFLQPQVGCENQCQFERARICIVRPGAQSWRITVDLGKTSEELIVEIERINEAIQCFQCVESIRVCAAKYENGQKIGTEERSLERAELVQVIRMALCRRMEDLRTDLRALDRDSFLTLIKEAALKIEPANAEIIWEYADPFDPYGIGLDLPEEARSASEFHSELSYVSSPGSWLWVWSGDLPNETRQALRLKIAEKVAAVRLDSRREDPDALARPSGLPPWLQRQQAERLASQLESSES